MGRTNSTPNAELAGAVNNVVSNMMTMFDTAAGITFIDSRRFSEAVDALAKHMKVGEHESADEKAEEILLAVARVWPASYADMIASNKRMRVIRSILADGNKGDAA